MKIRVRASDSRGGGAVVAPSTGPISQLLSTERGGIPGDALQYDPPLVVAGAGRGSGHEPVDLQLAEDEFLLLEWTDGDAVFLDVAGHADLERDHEELQERTSRGEGGGRGHWLHEVEQRGGGKLLELIIQRGNQKLRQLVKSKLESGALAALAEKAGFSGRGALVQMAGQLADCAIIGVDGGPAWNPTDPMAELPIDVLRPRKGLFRVDDWARPKGDALTPEQVEGLRGGRDILVLIHGTFSCTAKDHPRKPNALRGSFRSLAKSGGELWKQMFQDHLVLAFDHPTMSEGPIPQAKALLKALPEGSTVRLMATSRGGLVGELLCVDQVAPKRSPGLEAIAKGIEGVVRTRKDRNITVKRFLRVATPAGGTWWLSDRTDRGLLFLLNVLGATTGWAASPVYSAIMLVVKALLEGTADPDKDGRSALPGLNCMRVRSGFQKVLNRHCTAVDTPHLAVMAGDASRFGSFWKTLASLVALPVMQERSDNVIPVRSMVMGAKREDDAVVKCLLRDKDIHHLSYFDTPDRAKRMLRWVHEGKKAPFIKGSRTFPKGTGRLGYARGTRTKKRDGVVVFVPGVLGSTLVDQRGGKQSTVWVGPKLVTQFNEKMDGAYKLRATEPLPLAYKKTLEHLDACWSEVVPFPYDWRGGLDDAASELVGVLEAVLDGADPALPVHVIAHSLGTQAVRALGITTEGQAVLARIRQTNGRIALLAPPNEGAWLAAAPIVGDDFLVSLIDAAGLWTIDGKDIANVFSMHRSVTQMLPLAFFERGMGVDALKMVGTPGWNPNADLRALLRARLEEGSTFRENLRKVDGVHFDVFLGSPHNTPVAVTRRRWRKGYRLVEEQKGDGTILFASSYMKGARMWQLEGDHTDIATWPSNLNKVSRVLAEGKGSPVTMPVSTKPPTQFTVSSRGGLSSDVSPPAVLPSLEEAWRHCMGASQAARPLDTTHIQLTVAHASIEHAHGEVVVVGHNRGQLIVGPEAKLDTWTNGALTRGVMLGIHPSHAGESQLYSVGDSEKQVLVVGLGNVGSLTIEALTDALQRAFVRVGHALTHRSHVRLSSVLVGRRSGMGFGPAGAMKALVTAAGKANLQLARVTGHQDFFHEVEVLERFSNVAHRAMRHADSLGKSRDLLPPEIRVTTRRSAYDVDRGGLPTPPRMGSGGTARQIRIFLDRAVTEGAQARPASLNFEVYTTRAKLQASRRSIDPDLVDRLLATESSNNPRLLAFLFHYLWPRELWELASTADSLSLGLDRFSARIPWELLRPTRSLETDTGIPLGLVRQLETTAADIPPSSSRRALVIGDPLLGPDAELGQLEGARQEALAVRDTLQELGYDVSLLLQPTLREVLEALTLDIDILHVAAHGIHEPGRPWESGVVLEDGQRLTPAVLRTFRRRPTIAFFNCCHLGSQDLEGAPRFASGVADALIGQGVNVVVAAGWEVDDRGAKVFAQTFYEELVEGRPLARAAEQARRTTKREGLSGDLTWGALQVYGAPGFLLQAVQRPSAARRSSWRDEPVSPLELEQLLHLELLEPDDDAEGLKERFDRWWELLSTHSDWRTEQVLRNAHKVLSRMAARTPDSSGWTQRLDVVATWLIEELDHNETLGRLRRHSALAEQFRAELDRAEE